MKILMSVKIIFYFTIFVYPPFLTNFRVENWIQCFYLVAGSQGVSNISWTFLFKVFVWILHLITIITFALDNRNISILLVLVMGQTYRKILGGRNLRKATSTPAVCDHLERGNFVSNFGSPTFLRSSSIWVCLQRTLGLVGG